MKRKTLLIAGVFLGTMLLNTSVNAQISDEEVSAYMKMEEEKRAQKDSVFKYGSHTNQNPHNHSPLSTQQKEKFKSLSYYPVDLKYRVKVEYEKLSDQVEITMPFQNGSPHKYIKHGILKFQIDGKDYQLSAYKNTTKTKIENEFDDYLFIPFKDQTNGDETFGGGRYIQWHVPNGNFDELDFNNSFNPFCVYNPKTKCPIPPNENHLKVAIKAGEKDFEL